jgi:predicted anti-sigma-YlaC factor YlaD
VKPCPRPLDPIDAEAVAAGAEPLVAPDAAAHARECPGCQALIVAARAVSEALEGVSGVSEPVGGLAERVTRLRAFSRRERRTYALWNAPVLLNLALAISGLAVLALPVLSASEQASLGAAAAAPLLALLRSAIRWSADLVRLAPTALEALSEGMRQEGGMGLVALLLLPPLSLGLSRIMARASGSKR